MLDAVYRSIPVALVFLTAAVFSWVWGGARADVLYGALPWVWALALEVLFFMPQRHPWETILDARARLGRALKRDPLTWCFVAFLVLLAIPFGNTGLCPNCDADAIAGGAVAKPPFSFLPFCVSVRDHYGVVQWFVPAFTATLAARHALVRSGKRFLLEALVWNGAMLAVFGFIQMGTKAQAPYWNVTENPISFFSTFGYANMGGAFFALMTALSAGLLFFRIKETRELPEPITGDRSWRVRYRPLRAWYPAFPLFCNYMGALCTYSRAAILTSSVLMFLAYVYWLLDVASWKNRVKRFKALMASVAGGVAVLIAVNVFAPKNLMKELKGTTLDSVASRVTLKAQYHGTAAWNLFMEHPLFGCGGWGYKHLSLPYVPPAYRHDFTLGFSQGCANVHNDYLQFLCEHGLAGGALLLAAFVLLLWPILSGWKRLCGVAVFTGAADRPRPAAVFALPAGAFWTLLGAVTVLIHAFADCPLRSAAVLTSFLLALTCAEGFLPHRNAEEET